MHKLLRFIAIGTRVTLAADFCVAHEGTLLW